MIIIVNLNEENDDFASDFCDVCSKHGASH